MYKIKMASGVSEIRAEQTFFVFFRNFGAVERRWPKGMIVTYAIKSPLVLSSVGGALARHLAKCFNIIHDDGLDSQSGKKNLHVNTDTKIYLKNKTEREGGGEQPSSGAKKYGGNDAALWPEDNSDEQVATYGKC